MNSAKAAVRHDRDYIAVLQLWSEMNNDRVGVRKGRRGLSVSRDVSDEFVDIEQLVAKSFGGRHQYFLRGLSGTVRGLSGFPSAPGQ